MNAGSKRVTFITRIFGLACLGAVTSAWGQSAESLTRKGNELYKRGEYQQAVDAYRQALVRSPENSAIKYNLGTALAKADRTPEAQQVLTESAEAPGGAHKRDSYYNMGTALGEAAQKIADPGAAQGQGNGGAQVVPQVQGGPDEAAALKQKIGMLEQSLGAFRKSILTDAKDDYAKYNYETVLEQLRMLRQMQQQMQQQGQGKNQQQNQGQQNQNQQGGKNNQDKQQGNKQNQGGKKPQQQGDKSQQQGQNGEEGGGEQLKPEQIDAQALLNLLEAEKPEQFKQLFRERGGDGTKQPPQRNW